MFRTGRVRIDWDYLEAELVELIDTEFPFLAEFRSAESAILVTSDSISDVKQSIVKKFFSVVARTLSTPHTISIHCKP
jgi:hypothetical protein